MTLTTLMRGPGSGSFDPNTRLTAQTAKEEINPFPRKEEVEFFFFSFSIFSCIFGFPSMLALTSLVAQIVKNPPVMQEFWVQSLGWEDTLKKELATYSSILAWRIPWTEEPGRL